MANAKKTPDMDEFLKEIGVDPKDASITSKKRILAAMNWKSQQSVISEAVKQSEAAQPVEAKMVPQKLVKPMPPMKDVKLELLVEINKKLDTIIKLLQK